MNNLNKINIKTVEEFKIILDKFMSQRKSSKIINVTPESLYPILLELANSTQFKMGGGNLLVDIGSPTNDIGFENDIYIDKSIGLMYQKINSLWITIVDLSSSTGGGFNTIVGTIDATSNPNYPTSDIGHGYRIISAGKIGGINGLNVEIGDVVFSLTNNNGGTQAQVGTDFYIIRNNISEASETISGFAQIATEPETILGQIDNKIISPLKLKQYFQNLKFNTTIGNNSDIQFIVQHNLNNQYNIVKIFDTNLNVEIYPDVFHTSVNSTTIKFLNPPKPNQYTVFINAIL